MESDPHHEIFFPSGSGVRTKNTLKVTFESCPPSPKVKSRRSYQEVASSLPVILPNRHSHDLELSGSCQNNKSEFLLNQYQQSCTFQLEGQGWDNDPLAVLETSPDPAWWTEYVNLDTFPSDIEANQASQVAPISVSRETFGNNEVDLENMSAVSQPADNLPFGESFDLGLLTETEINELASQTFPDDTYCMYKSDSISPTQWDSTSFDSSSTPNSDFDFSINSEISTPPGSDVLYQISYQNGKIAIPAPQYIHCTHCLKVFSDEQHLGSHIQRSHKHLDKPNICTDCGKSFPHGKDLIRHRQTVQCRKDGKSPPPRRPHVCRCGLDFKRRDHLLRHIRKEDERRYHHAVPVGRAN